MKILGISAYYHDSAICLTENGKIVFAAQEERYSRIKNDEHFPELALKRCMEQCSFSLNELDAIVFYEKPFIKFERILETYMHYAPRGMWSFMKAMNAWTGKKLFIKSEIRKALKKTDGNYDSKKVPLLFSEHHLSHAASAFYPSPFASAAILTIDGVGEHTTTSLAYGQDSDIRILKEIHFPHSIGLLYSAITYFTGFKVNSDEYKVMGLAAYGDAEAAETKHYIELIEQHLIDLREDGSYHLKMDQFTYPYTLRMVSDQKWEQLFGIRKREAQEELTQSHCNLAYAFQKITERSVMQLCREIKKTTGSEYLCLAGGVALNGVINGILQRSALFKDIFIQPSSGDAGGALGAALAAYHLHFKQPREMVFPDNMQNSLLGSYATEAEVDKIVSMHAHSVLCKDEEELCRKTAQLIADGKVIGWFQGRMEFGPRALGNRSILGDARHPDMQKHLNLKIKNRESFRPFAPAVLDEDAAEYFDFTGISPYMLQVHPVKGAHLKPVPENYGSLSLSEKLYTLKSDIPAVTHVDFSARIQTVNKEQHPLFWKLIHHFKQLSGYGMLINTSFNSKDEPIVCSPDDAYHCFIKTGIDVLVIGNTMFYK